MNSNKPNKPKQPVQIVDVNGHVTTRHKNVEEPAAAPSDRVKSVSTPRGTKVNLTSYEGSTGERFEASLGATIEYVEKDYTFSHSETLDVVAFSLPRGSEFHSWVPGGTHYDGDFGPTQYRATFDKDGIYRVGYIYDLPYDNFVQEVADDLGGDREVAEAIVATYLQTRFGARAYFDEESNSRMVELTMIEQNRDYVETTRDDTASIGHLSIMTASASSQRYAFYDELKYGSLIDGIKKTVADSGLRKAYVESF